MRIADLPPFSLDEDGHAILLFNDTFVRTPIKVRSCTWEILPLREVNKFPSMHTSRYVFRCSSLFLDPSMIRRGLKGGRPYYIPTKKDFDKLVESYKQFEYDQKMDRIEKKMEEDWKRIDEEKMLKKTIT